jgi:LemA protein
MMTWTIAAAAALLVLTILVYNSLVRLRNQADNAWSDIDVQLKRRHDLIPNLVEAVRGYTAHERDTLEAVVSARARAMSVEGPAARAAAEGDLQAALRSLFALSESYPQLQAANNFLSLQDSLGRVEDALQNARRYYNAVVRDLNTRVQQFPTNLVAAAFGIGEREFFSVAGDENQAPTVRL